jgi:F420-non-reducing hydrogenase iron-sulfur subunit
MGVEMEKNAKKACFEPEIVVLYCQNCLAKDEKIKKDQNKTLGFKANFLMMPCSSKVEASHILKILADGIDGVQVVGCKTDQCRFLVGSSMADKRMEHAGKLLDDIHMGGARLGMDRGKNLSSKELIGIARERAKAVKPLGPNPMKGLKDR